MMNAPVFFPAGPRAGPETCVLAISNHSERSIIAQMLQNGTSGYLLKNSSADELARSILSALEGDLVLTGEVTKILAKGEAAVRASPRLIRREREVVKLVAGGVTTAGIAEEWFISEQGIR